MDKTCARYHVLSPVQQHVSDIVADMEAAFVTGSHSRVMTSMTSHVPYASDIAFLKTSMQNMPTLGWSCWDMSTLLAHLLNRQGIEAGITIAFGAEPGAPAVPHSMVRIVDDTNEVFYSDPYFGVGVLSDANPSTKIWLSRTVHASMHTPMRHSNTHMVSVAHKSHPRDYDYHVLPGVLTSEQLQGALWQAEHYGGSRRYLRSIGGGSLWLLKSGLQGDAESICSQWQHANVIAPAKVTEGNWWELKAMIEELSANDRESALERVFSRPAL